MAEWTQPEVGFIRKKTKIIIENTFWALCGILFARANIEGIYAFGTAYLAFLILKGEKNFLAGFLGIVFGCLTLQNFSLIGLISGEVAIYYLVLRKTKIKNEIVLLAASALGACSISGILYSFWLNGVNVEELIRIVARGILAATFAILLNIGLIDKNNIFKAIEKKELHIVILLILSIALSGLNKVYWGDANLQIIAVSFLVLYIASRFGAGLGAGAGAVLGFLLQWNFGTENLVNAGIYGLSGFIAGGFGRFGKPIICIAYVSSAMMFTFFVNSVVIPMHLLSSGIGLLLFMLMPQSKGKIDILKKKVVPEIETTVSKVKTMSELFDQLAFGIQAASREYSKLKPEVPELMNMVVERICNNCSNMSYCWEKEFHKTYNKIFNIFLAMEKINEVNFEDYPPEWKKGCNRFQEVILAIRFILDQQKARETWEKRLALNKDALAEQYKSVSDVIGHLAKELNSRHNKEDGRPLTWERQQRNLIDIGIETFVKEGNAISGDNFNAIPLSSTKTAIIVCDGMGVGEEAAKMSSAALTILEQLLSTGFDPEGAVKALNSILVLRSPEESFVTVDMAILDFQEQKGKIIKIGAAPSYVKGVSGVKKLSTSSLPAGIFNEIEIPVMEISFKDETLILLTDGVIDAGKSYNASKDWIEEVLRQTDNHSAAEIAEKIVTEAKKMSNCRMEDDGIVLAVKKKEKTFDKEKA